MQVVTPGDSGPSSEKPTQPRGGRSSAQHPAWVLPQAHHALPPPESYFCSFLLGASAPPPPPSWVRPDPTGAEAERQLSRQALLRGAAPSRQRTEAPLLSEGQI